MNANWMSPSYAEQIMLDAEAEYLPEADDVVSLARSYLAALECLECVEDKRRWNR